MENFENAKMHDLLPVWFAGKEIKEGEALGITMSNDVRFAVSKIISIATAADGSLWITALMPKYVKRGPSDPAYCTSIRGDGVISLNAANIMYVVELETR
jgi:hypothetical protein